RSRLSRAMKGLLRWVLLVLLAGLALQLFFLQRIALAAWLDPQSTTFQRSEAWRIVNEKGRLPWNHQWVPYQEIADSLKRAVIASEDDSFVNHDGVDWEALERAWERNARAEALAAKRGAARPRSAAPQRPARIVGGSTITQQLA